MTPTPIREDDPLCARCGCYRSAHGEGERCEPVGWSFTPAIREDEMVARLRTSALMLLQNAEGCAANHYGEDYQGTMPGWLVDCRRDIEIGLTALSSEREILRKRVKLLENALREVVGESNLPVHLSVRE